MPNNPIEAEALLPATLSRRRILANGGRLAVAETIAATTALVAAPQVRAQQDGAEMSDNEKTVRAFIAAWSRLDPEELVGYFTEDGVYHNMMLAPVAGHDSLKEFIGGFLSSWSETDWQVINIVTQGDLVIAERLDKTRIGDIHIDLPCVGVFEMEGGKIKVWRDYFDLATYTSAFTE